MVMKEKRLTIKWILFIRGKMLFSKNEIIQHNFLLFINVCKERCHSGDILAGQK
jgi:hypothetical protein